MTGWIAVVTAALGLFGAAAVSPQIAGADLSDEPIVTSLEFEPVPVWCEVAPCDLAPLGFGHFSSTGGPPPSPDNLTFLSPWPSTSVAGAVRTVALSPNGERVAAGLAEGPLDCCAYDHDRVVVMDSNGSNLRTVWERDPPVFCLDPKCPYGSWRWGSAPPRLDFSPAGESLLLTLETATEVSWLWNTQVILLDLDTLEPVTLVDSEPPERVDKASWSADGESIFYTTRNDDTSTAQFVQSDLAGGELWSTDVTYDFTWEPHPSPDGTKLAYYRWDYTTETNNLYVMDVATESSTLLVENAGVEGSLSWSADGDELVYAVYDDVEDEWEIRSIAATGGSPTTVMEPDTTYYPWAFALRSLSDLPSEDDGDALVEAMAAAYFVDEYGGTTPDAVAWMGVQNRADGLDETLAAEMPAGSYGGMWFGNATRDIRVALTDDDYEADADEILGRRGVDSDTEFVIVPSSLGELGAARASLETTLDDLIEDGIVAIATNVADNRVELEVGTSASSSQVADIEDAASKVAVDTKLVTGASGGVAVQPLSCDFPHCDPPLRGGVFIQSVNKNEDGNTNGCTAGFVARSKSDDKPYLMTAGHCFDGFEDDESTWEAFLPGLVDGEEIGLNHNPYLFGDDGDVGLISIESGSLWRTPSVGGKIKPLIYVRKSGTGSTPQAPAYYIRRVGTSVEGKILCATGATNGSSCGEVTRLDVSVKVGEGVLGLSGTGVDHLGEMKNCDPSEGDSGGPVFKRHVAYGLLQGAKDDCRIYFQSARRAENALNVRIVTRR